MTRKRSQSPDAPVSPPRRRLQDASALSRSRKRVTLSSKNSAFDRDPASGMPVCNSCRRVLEIDCRNLSKKRQDEIIAECMCTRLWLDFHWKTFFCMDCMLPAVKLCLDIMERETPSTEACLHCLKPDSPGNPVALHPIEYGEDEMPTVPRQLALCAECARAKAHRLVALATPDQQ